MAMTRGRPGSPAVRKSKNVGPDYPEDRFENPVNAGIDTQYEPDNDAKTLRSPTATTVGGEDLPLHDDYDAYWEGR